MTYVNADIMSTMKTNPTPIFPVTLFEDSNSLLFFVVGGNVIERDFAYTAMDIRDLYDWILIRKKQMVDEMYSHRESLKRN